MIPNEHIKIMTDEMKKMASDGHLKDFEVSAAAGGVEYELENLKTELEKRNERINNNTDN